MVSGQARWLATFGLLAATLLACGSREKPKVSAQSQTDVGVHLTAEDTLADRGSTTPGQDAATTDSSSKPSDAGAAALGDADVVNHDTIASLGDTLGNGTDTGMVDAGTDSAGSGVDDADAGAVLQPDVYGDDDVSPTPPLSQICGADGVGPSPKVGDPCTALGERRCVDQKLKVLKIGMDPGVHTTFCGRPYFVACGKNAQGKLVWQPPQTCDGPGVSLKSSNPKYKCNTPQGIFYDKVCRPGASGTAHFCCPRIAESNHVHPKDHGRAVCYAGWTSYARAVSYNQLSAEDRTRVNKASIQSLEACSGEVHDCVYWLGFTSLPKERLWCIDPKKKPEKDQYGQFKPPQAEWLKPHCIQVSDTKVRFAKTCKESGYWDAPGGP